MGWTEIAKDVLVYLGIAKALVWLWETISLFLKKSKILSTRAQEQRESQTMRQFLFDFGPFEKKPKSVSAST